MPIRVLAAAVALAIAASFTACASAGSGPGGDSAGDDVPAPIPAGDVVAQGTVLAEDGAAAQFCIGAVMESYPPQCGGMPLAEWTFPEGTFEEASGVRWGTYAAVGRWDGETFTVTGDVVPLALYSPPAMVDERLDEANAGDGDEATLTAIQDELSELGAESVLSTWQQNGYLFVQVRYDDGTVQGWMDTRWGPDLVAVQSALLDA
ncbi:hypothetical protein [Agromyces sp. SYSU T00194]|uniref:hypothetical protein n=1 Tax=Agromyces chitinivorans TaxID=3158560 RepID=UPI00339AF8E2